MDKEYEHYEQLKLEMARYADGSMIQGFDEILKECNTIVVRTICGAFGLRFFNDLQGGKVTTIHNFTQGICATDDDYMRFQSYNTPYNYNVDRADYNHTQRSIRKAIIKSDAPIISGYTGKELPRDGRAQLEHIVSIGELESMPENFLFMDKKDRVNLAYIDENLTMLESSANQSKDNLPLREWLGRTKKGLDQNNAERYDIDVEKAMALDDNARKAISQKQKKVAFDKQSKELVITGIQSGLTMGFRELLAAMLVDFFDEAIDCVRSIINYKNNNNLSFENVVFKLKESLINIKNRIVTNYKTYLEAFAIGGISGFCANLLEFLINNFVTTAKHIASIVRESIYSLIRVAKITTDKNYPTKEEKNKAAAAVLMSSMGICLTALLGEAIHKALINIPYSTELSQAISGIITGVGTIMVVYYFNSVQQELLSSTAKVGQNASLLVDTIDSYTNNQSQIKKQQDELQLKINKINKLKF